MNEEQNKNIINTKLDQALYYLEKLGWSVIPVGPDKKPLVEWKLYQSQKATREQLIKWYSKPNVNIGIITGKISNLVVIDIDPRHDGTDEAFTEIKTVKSATGGGGWHYYFQYQEGIQNSAGVKPGIDIRGDGGYVIAPPSIHNSGKSYDWINNPENTSILPLPSFITEWLSSSKNFTKVTNSKWDKNLLNGASEGSRNDSAASVVGKLLKRFKQVEWEEEVWPLLQGWNLKNNPPLPETELRTVYESIINSELANNEKENGEDEGNGRRSVADRLVDLTLASNTELYIDQTGEPHITFPEKPIVGFPIKSSVFKRWLAGKYWKETNKGFSGETFLQTVNSLEGKAFHEGEVKNLFNRVARENQEIFFDLGDDKQVVKVTPEGWEITTNCPIKFRRFSHQQPQIQPLKGGRLDSVNNYLNLKSDTDRLLFLTYLVTVFVPDIPRVVLINIGDQGAAKSTALRIARSLVDPSVSELLSPPSDITELAQASNHHYCLYLDNLSYLRDEVSDALCRLATGIGFTKRKLFTNDEDILFNQKAAVGITGINLVAQRADLLDRCLILSFERIPEDKRIDEEEFWRKFNEDKPYILGAIFTALSGVLKTIPTFRLAKKPRMADYAKYAAASAIAIGKSADDFLNAFTKNIGRQNQAAIESSPTAQSILNFMSEKDEWSGSSSELHKELKQIVEKSNLQLGGSDGFPKSSNWLWKRIMQVRPNLTALGIKVWKTDAVNNSVINLSKVVQEKENTSYTSNGLGSMEAMEVNKPQLEEKSETDLSSIPGLEGYQ